MGEYERKYRGGRSVTQCVTRIQDNVNETGPEDRTKINSLLLANGEYRYDKNELDGYANEDDQQNFNGRKHLQALNYECAFH